MVTTIDASFSYGGRDIFSGLSFTVREGEVLCVLGPNGCGKSTLMNCLAGVLKLREGIIELDGQDLRSLNPQQIARRTGVVAQEQSSPFPYPVIEIVRMGRAPHISFFGRPSKKDTLRAEKALETVGVVHLADKPYTRISGGERQLVLIARALCQEPRLILMDEPTSHLDFRNQALVLRIVNQLAREGMSIIMTTHMPNHAFLVSTRAALMNQGRFVALGDVETVVTEENLRYTYGIDVRIVAVRDGVEDRLLRFCIPALDKQSNASKPEDG